MKSRHPVLAVAALLLMVALPTGSAPAQVPLVGSSGSPEKVSAGEWDGTWYYVNRDYRMALWLRTVDGKLQHRMQITSLFAPEGFLTDWSGRAEYTTRNTPGVFELKIDEIDDDELRGTWFWDLQFVRSGRREEANVRIYRAGVGRTFVMKFEQFERTIRRGTEEQLMSAPRAWTFIKASKRQVLWEELPF